MRQVMNISLPSTMAGVVKKAVKEGNYISTSEFFRDLLRSWMEDRLLMEVNAGRQEIKAGKGTVLRSLKDLR